MIERKLFARIHALMPIVCVDLIVWRGAKLLLLKRGLVPLKGCWFFPGGRIMRGETAIDAGHRIVHGEAGLSVSDLRFVTYTESQYDEDAHGHGKGTHSVSLVFECWANAGKIRPDKNHSDARWATVDEAESLDEFGVMRPLLRLALRDWADV